MVLPPDENGKQRDPLPPPEGVFGLLFWIMAVIWGRGFVRGGEDDGLKDAITLLGFLLVWQLALLAYVQTHPNPELNVVAVYFAVSILPLVGIFSICAIPTLKLAHRRIGFRLGMLAVAVVMSLGTSYVARTLPGQFQKGTYLKSGHKLLAVNLERLSAASIENDWKVTLSERASRFWRVEQVHCYRDEQHNDPIPVFQDSSKATSSYLEGSFDGPKHEKYFFRIDLEEIGTDKPNFEFTKEDISFEIEPQ